MPFVVDASVAAKWILHDEASETANALLKTVIRQGAFVPAIFPFEVENVLLAAQRRGRVDATSVAEALNLLKHLDLDIEPFLPSQIGRHLELALRFKLTAYEAAYLVLSLRRDATLFTADHPLETAAKSLGIGTVLV
jgi:predicted nucleic acid-binding protein